MTEGALLLREPLPLSMVAAAVLVLFSVATVLRAEHNRGLPLGLDLS